MVHQYQKDELKYFIITRGALSVVIISTIMLRWLFVICLDYQGRVAQWFFNLTEHIYVKGKSRHGIDPLLKKDMNP